MGGCGGIEGLCVIDISCKIAHGGGAVLFWGCAACVLASRGGARPRPSSKRRMDNETLPGKDVWRRATVKQPFKGVRQGIFIRLDGLSPIPAGKTPRYLCGNAFFFFCAASCCVPAAAALPRQTQDTQQPVVGRNIRSPWMPFWGWGNVLLRSRVSFCAASSM